MSFTQQSNDMNRPRTSSMQKSSQQTQDPNNSSPDSLVEDMSQSIDTDQKSSGDEVSNDEESQISGSDLSKDNGSSRKRKRRNSGILPTGDDTAITTDPNLQATQKSSSVPADNLNLVMDNLTDLDKARINEYRVEIVNSGNAEDAWYRVLNVMAVAEWDRLKVFALEQLLDEALNGNQATVQDSNNDEKESELAGDRDLIEEIEKRVRPLVDLLRRGQEIPQALRTHHREYDNFSPEINRGFPHARAFQEWGPKVRPLPVLAQRMTSENTFKNNREALQQVKELKKAGKKVMLIMGEAHSRVETLRAHYSVAVKGLSEIEKKAYEKIKKTIIDTLKGDLEEESGEKEDKEKDDLEEASGGLDDTVYPWEYTENDDLETRISADLFWDSMILEMLSLLRDGSFDPLRRAEELDQALPQTMVEKEVAIFGKMGSELFSWLRGSVTEEQWTAIGDAQTKLFEKMSKAIYLLQRGDQDAVGLNFSETNDNKEVRGYVENVTHIQGLSPVESSTLKWSDHFRQTVKPSNDQPDPVVLRSEYSLMLVQRNLDLAGQLVDRMDNEQEVKMMVMFTGEEHLHDTAEATHAIHSAKLSLRNQLVGVNQDPAMDAKVREERDNAGVEMLFKPRGAGIETNGSDANVRHVIIMPSIIDPETSRRLYSIMNDIEYR
ncbi:hypothetical protein [Okeania sp. SIO2B3]|uniref:hypothetical protein n=1 Tax=Okeania sp. SIO2B3 TaxID=2607784 RepID=UPI0025F5C6ED|nr:hypothetical protein [Okeania sp. SIO2B3]